MVKLQSATELGISIKRQREIRLEVAGCLKSKANAIAEGDYDKDVDYDLEDRVMWAARLYAIANKIKEGVKLTKGEHDELCDAANYLPHDNESPFVIREL